jgi:hypothetical protein
VDRLDPRILGRRTARVMNVQEYRDRVTGVWDAIGGDGYPEDTGSWIDTGTELLGIARTLITRDQDETTGRLTVSSQERDTMTAALTALLAQLDSAFPAVGGDGTYLVPSRQMVVLDGEDL